MQKAFGSKGQVSFTNSACTRQRVQSKEEGEEGGGGYLSTFGDLERIGAKPIKCLLHFIYLPFQLNSFIKCNQNLIYRETS